MYAKKESSDIFNQRLGYVIGNKWEGMKKIMKESLNYIKYRTLTSLTEESRQEYEKAFSEQTPPKQAVELKAPSVTITFMEAVHGVEKEVIIPIHSFCRSCDTAGKIEGKSCPVCQGKKVIVTNKKILVKIPAGIDNGQFLALNGGSMSKVRVKVNVEEHPKFHRKGYDVYSTEFFDTPKYAGGSSIYLEVLDGTPIYRAITKMTEDGTQICYKGRGIPMLKDKTVRGDHYITLRKRPLIHEDQWYWAYQSEHMKELSKWEREDYIENSQEIFETGGELLAMGDYDYGVKVLKLAALCESGQANILLGYCYEQGIGVLKDSKMAEEYYRLGAQFDEEYYGAYCDGRGLTEEGLERATEDGRVIYQSFFQER